MIVLSWLERLKAETNGPNPLTLQLLYLHKQNGYGIVILEILSITLVKEEWGNPLFRVVYACFLFVLIL